jgi:hypothetical protein
MKENLPSLMRMGGACPIPHLLSLSTITYKVVLYAPAERAATLLIFLFVL